MEFSLRTAFKKAWSSYTANLAFFLILVGIGILFQFIAPEPSHISWLVSLACVISILWGFVLTKAALAIVDGQRLTVRLATFQSLLPNFRQFFIFLGIVILTGVIYFAGFLALILPGFYLVGRLMFSSFSFIGTQDRQLSVTESLKHSWNITKGEVIWTNILTLLIVFALTVAGTLLFRVGELVTLPIALLLLAYLFRALEASAPQRAAQAAAAKEVQSNAAEEPSDEETK